MFVHIHVASDGISSAFGLWSVAQWPGQRSNSAQAIALPPPLLVSLLKTTARSINRNRTLIPRYEYSSAGYPILIASLVYARPYLSAARTHSTVHACVQAHTPCNSCPKEYINTDSRDVYVGDWLTSMAVCWELTGSKHDLDYDDISSKLFLVTVGDCLVTFSRTCASRWPENTTHLHD